jgi:hypothetical protein
MWLWERVPVMVSPTVMAVPGQLQTKNAPHINFCPNAAGLGQKNCKNREKNAKNARKLMPKIAKNAQKRQIVENCVDQVDLAEVPLPETKKREKKEK